MKPQPASDEERLAFERLRTFWKLSNPNPIAFRHSFLSADLLWADWLEHHLETDWTDVVDNLEDFFGLDETTEAEFRQFLGYEPPSGFSRKDRWREPRTLGEVSVWIERKCGLPTFEPASICGKTCSRAGVFLALQRLHSFHGVATSDIGPSSRIANEFETFHSFCDFTVAIQLLTGVELKLKPGIGGDYLNGGGVMFLVSIVFLVLTIFAAELVHGGKPTAELVWVSLAGIALACLVMGRGTYIANKTNADLAIAASLPEGISTFGDLARFLDRPPSAS